MYLYILWKNNYRDVLLSTHIKILHLITKLIVENEKSLEEKVSHSSIWLPVLLIFLNDHTDCILKISLSLPLYHLLSYFLFLNVHTLLIWQCIVIYYTRKPLNKWTELCQIMGFLLKGKNPDKKIKLSRKEVVLIYAHKILKGFRYWYYRTFNPHQGNILEAKGERF